MKRVKLSITHNELPTFIRFIYRMHNSLNIEHTNNYFTFKILSEVLNNLGRYLLVRQSQNAKKISISRIEMNTILALVEQKIMIQTEPDMLSLFIKLTNDFNKVKYDNE